MQGHVKIELRDVYSGRKKIYEKHNMVTNAISKLVNFSSTHSLGTSSLNIYNTSHWSNLLGGLVLFDTVLTENANNIYLPSGVKPVGYGIQGDTNSYTGYSEWGLYNTQESDTSASDTKVMVWDFSTSHANNRIASLALTHKNNGLFGWGTSTYYNTQRALYENIALGTIITQSSKGKQGINTANCGVVGSNLSLKDGSYVDFCIDSDNDVKYMLKVCQDGLSIIKHNMYPEKFDVFRSSNYYQEYVEETYSETFSSGYFYHFYNPDEKILYFWTLSMNIGEYAESGLTITINKFDMTNKSLTKDWKIASLTGRVYSGIVVTSGKIYYGSVDSTYCIKAYDVSGGTITKLVEMENANGYGLCGGKPYILNGLVYMENYTRNAALNINGYTVIIDTSDDSIRYTNALGNSYAYDDYTKGQKVPPIDNTQIAFGSRLDAGVTLNNVIDLQGYDGNVQIGNVTAPIHYLGTIHNLSEPIVKNASQTMKVTYTLTAESE